MNRLFSKLFSIPYIFLTVFSLYGISVAGLILTLNFVPSNDVKLVVGVYALPLMFAFYPIYPALDLLGLLEGEWWAIPTPLGFVVGTVVYGILLFSIGKLILFFKNRRQTSQ